MKGSFPLTEVSGVDRDQSSFTKGVMFDGSNVMKNQKSTANKEFSPKIVMTKIHSSKHGSIFLEH
jgi:hypothetical protein